MAGQTALFAFLGLMALLAGRELLALGIAAAYRGGMLKRFRTAVLARSREDAEILAQRLRGEPDCERVISLPAGARDVLDELVQGGQIDRIVVQTGGMAREDIANLLQHVRHHVTPAYFVASAPRLAGFQRAPEEIGALPVFAVKRGPLSPAERAAKRLFDIVAASLALFTLAPLLLAVAIALRASGAKNPLVRLSRRGFDGREFWLLSFAHDAGETGRVRRLMRSTGVDALPQLMNVIAGDLSLVGPRAVSAGSSDEDRKVARFAAAQGLKPGLAQGFGVTSALGSLPVAASRERSRHDDLAYLDHWSLGMDIAVLATSLGRMCIVRDRHQA